MLASFLCGEFLLHIPYGLYFYLGSFSYTSLLASFCGVGKGGLTHPMLAFIIIIIIYLFLRGVCLRHFMLASFLSGEFLLHIPCWLHFYRGNFSYTSRAGFTFIWGVSLTHPMLSSFLSWEFLLHIPCCLHFYLGSFSYTSRAGFTFIWGVSLTHPMLVYLFCGEFLLHIPCWLHLYLGSFS